MIGDIVDVDEDEIPASLRRTITPSNKENVILVYNLSRRTMNYKNKRTGLSIKPDDNGTDGWRKVLRIIGIFHIKFIENVR